MFNAQSDLRLDFLLHIIRIGHQIFVSDEADGAIRLCRPQSTEGSILINPPFWSYVERPQ
jgi:hypothetical protein